MRFDLFAYKPAITFSHVVRRDGRRMTICNAITEDKVILYQGVAYCSPKDNFERKRGRKIALKKMMENAGWDKTIRAVVWREYFKTHKV